MTRNRFTSEISKHGYKLWEFCKYWGITERTYRRYCANAKLHDKLNKLIAGLPEKSH